MLYLKVAELLSTGLQTAIDQIRAGKLCLSSTVKQGAWARVPRSVGVRQVRAGGDQGRREGRPARWPSGGSRESAQRCAPVRGGLGRGADSPALPSGAEA